MPVGACSFDIGYTGTIAVRQRQGEPVSTTKTPWSTSNKVGFALALVFGLINLPSVFIEVEPGHVGPPADINIADTVLSAIVIAATIVAWVLRSRVAARIAAGAIILIVLTALPAFFVDIPAWLKAVTTLVTVLAVVTCVLILRPSTRSVAAASS
jgi:hypothetical protein